MLFTFVQSKNIKKDTLKYLRPGMFLCTCGCMYTIVKKPLFGMDTDQTQRLWTLTI